MGDSRNSCFMVCRRLWGEVPEPSNGAVSKSVVLVAADRGFEPLPLRQHRWLCWLIWQFGECAVAGSAIPENGLCHRLFCRSAVSAPPGRESRRLCPLTFLEKNGDRSATYDQEHHRDQGDQPERHSSEIEIVLIDPEGAKGCENDAEERQQGRLFPSQ